MEPVGAIDYRPLRAVDLPMLQQALPPLLGGLWSPRRLQELLQYSSGNPIHHCRVLSASTGDGNASELLGFAEILTVLDECQLLNIAILAGRQQLGLGRILLEEVLQEAAARGCRYCVLEVRASNSPALALYRTAGFVESGLRKAYYPPLGVEGEREDALLLRRELGFPAVAE